MSVDVLARLLVTKALERQGFCVFQIEDIDSVLDVLANWRPDLLVLDATTPGLDVVKVCTSLRGMEGGSHVRVLVLTAESDTETAARARGAGGWFLAARPFTSRLLGQRIRHMLRWGPLNDDRQPSESTPPDAVGVGTGTGKAG